MKAWQSALLLFFTSGIAASNGVKTMIADWFVNGRHVFRPRFILIGIILPLWALLAIQRCQYYAFEVPQQSTISKIEKANEKKESADKQKKTRDHKRWVGQHDIRHAQPTGLLYLMDFSTPRGPAVIENFLGESMLLHRDYALQDVFKNRPMIVRYGAWCPYAVVGVITLLLAAGAWVGRRQRLMQLLLCWWAFDVMLNIVLGFAINEVYIMASGWLFIIPVAIAFLIKSLSPKAVFPLEALVLFIALFLWVSNGMLIVQHLL